MYTLEKRVNRIIEMITCTLMVIMVMVAAYQVLSRYIFNAPSSFSEEFLRYSLIWLSMLGGAYVFGKKKHIAITFLQNKLSEKLKKVTVIIGDILVIVFSILVLIIGGAAIVSNTMGQMSASLGIQMGYIYMILPLTGFLILLYSILNLYQVIITKKPAEEFEYNETGEIKG
ncbi:TRAP transporter small permease [Metabacillus arenae]|uniref:TRAP transporter small permease n=1 Tax=Metabacillus arenae TaxID=2771434 RepID=A0A926NFJ4_9BACI|nr:TRAP transporter small permease [Metabacillus arenae]MBD1382544.1 TRAP transporter small permease [Metabacillus arenae]